MSKNELYDVIETFFKNGGTLTQLFEVLAYYFELEGSDEE